MQPGRGDSFLNHGWDGRICLINSGGSHHFATAHYLAGVARLPVELTGMLKGYQLNPAAINALTEQFELFAITRVSCLRRCGHCRPPGTPVTCLVPTTREGAAAA
jgi:hypothetical protein